MKTGIELITAERERQIEKEGWTPAHDDEHDDDSLAFAAACYTIPREFQQMKVVDEMEDVSCRGETPVWRLKSHRVPLLWPDSWSFVWWNPKNRVHDLTRAGALIAAEIDRLQRAEGE